MSGAGLLICAAACLSATATTPAYPKRGSESNLFPGLGTYQFERVSEDSLAQALFDQGMVLYYGFNRAEAERSFRSAEALDPESSMIRWGIALSLGPSINSCMLGREQFAAASRVVEEIQGSQPPRSSMSKGLLSAIVLRYSPTVRRTDAERNYAAALKQLADTYPQSADILTLYAESLMIQHAWSYWDREGNPRPWTEEILRALRSAMEADSLHPGANHLFIHAVEASPRPEFGLQCAKRFEYLTPGVGHLVHMPSHIYLRLGMYAEASRVNEAAILADEAYIAATSSKGLYPEEYYPHNFHFLWYSASMQGRGGRAIEAAEEVRRLTEADDPLAPKDGRGQYYWATPLFAYARFAKWEAILNSSPPESRLRLATGIHSYARGLAHIGLSDEDQGEAMLKNLEAIASEASLSRILVWRGLTATDLLALCTEDLRARMAWSRGSRREAIETLSQAVALEDRFPYNEPPDWYSPTRQLLGSALLSKGEFSRAERAFREDLERHPMNGWSLRGLQLALEAQGALTAAATVREEFLTAWSASDSASPEKIGSWLR